jgi:hypothetical protein
VGGGVRIETARLALREEDWMAMLAYRPHPRYLRYYEWDLRSADDVKAFLAMRIARQTEVLRIKF